MTHCEDEDAMIHDYMSLASQDNVVILRIDVIHELMVRLFVLKKDINLEISLMKQRILKMHTICLFMLPYMANQSLIIELKKLIGV